MTFNPRNPNLANVPSHVRARVVGPRMQNGMTFWTVHKIARDGSTGEQLGGPCFSQEQAFERADDYANGRVTFAFGRPFKRVPVGDTSG